MEEKNLIENLKSIIKQYNKANFLDTPFKDVLQIEHYIEELNILHQTKKLRVKSEVLKEQDFINVFTLSQNNYKDLIEIKKLYKNKKGIYILSFSNGKNYIGQTNNFCRRLDEYFDINNHTYIGHNEDIKELFKQEPDIITTIYFLEAEQDRNLLESTYIEKFQSANPLYGYNKTGGNE